MDIKWQDSQMNTQTSEDNAFIYNLPWDTSNKIITEISNLKNNQIQNRNTFPALFHINQTM